MKDHIVADLLSAYLDDEVSDAEREQVLVHLGDCADCVADLESLRFASDAARTLERPAMPELHRKQLWRELNRTRRAPANRWRALVAVAGTAAAIAAFAGLTMLGSTSGPNVLATEVSLEQTGAVTDAEIEAMVGEEVRTTADASAPGVEFGAEALTMPAQTAAPQRDPTVDGAEASTTDDDTSVNHGAQIARCEEAIRPGGDGGAIAIRYLIGTYDGTDAYILLYDIPRENPSHREVYVVSRSECRVLAHRSSV